MPDLQPDHAFVYRALLKKAYLHPETQEIQPEAFWRRPKNDWLGLSVGFTPEQSTRPFSKTYGVVELAVADVYNLLLEVVKTAEDHANLTGVPRRAEIKELDELSELYQQFRDLLVYDTDKAEFLARKLAEISRLVTPL